MQFSIYFVKHGAIPTHRDPIRLVPAKMKKAAGKGSGRASATRPPPGSVFSPDLRLGNGTRKVGAANLQHCSSFVPIFGLRLLYKSDTIKVCAGENVPCQNSPHRHPSETARCGVNTEAASPADLLLRV